jgi:hypothetical protein
VRGRKDYPMTLDIEREMAVMQGMAVKQLQAKYTELFGELPRSRHKEHLVRRIAWRMQALAEGGLAERARQKAADLADDACLRLSRPRRLRAEADGGSSRLAGAGTTAGRDKRLPMPGTILVRRYHGQTLEVKVLEAAFDYNGRIFPSLTAVAKQITGRHWNGFHFFGLGKGHAQR